MAASPNKSLFLESGLDNETKAQIQSMMPIQFEDLDKGFKYLCFYLKPNNYKRKISNGFYGKLKREYEIGQIASYL